MRAEPPAAQEAKGERAGPPDGPPEDDPDGGGDDGDEDGDDGQEDPVRPPNWSRFDLGFALQQLRSVREGGVRRMLRKTSVGCMQVPSACRRYYKLRECLQMFFA